MITYPEPFSNDSNSAAPSRLVGLRADARPESRAPCSVRPQREAQQRLPGNCEGRARVFLLRSPVRSTHVLPTRARMAVHEGQATSNSSRFTCGAHEVLAAEACIAMNLPVVFLWEDDPLQESRVSSKPVAWKPYPEGKILLTIGPKWRSSAGCVRRRRERPPHTQ